MNYDSSKLKSVADCDKVLDELQKEKAVLEFRKTSQTFRQTSFSENSDEVETNLANVTAELESVINTIATMPEGLRKEDFITERLLLEARQRNLQRRMLTYGDVVDVLRDVDLGRTEVEIAEIDKVVPIIEERKTVLLAA